MTRLTIFLSLLLWSLSSALRGYPVCQFCYPHCPPRYNCDPIEDYPIKHHPIQSIEGQFDCSAPHPKWGNNQCHKCEDEKICRSSRNCAHDRRQKTCVARREVASHRFFMSKIEAKMAKETANQLIHDKIYEYGNLEGYDTLAGKLAYIKTDLKSLTGKPWDQMIMPEEQFLDVPRSLTKRIVMIRRKITPLVLNFLKTNDSKVFEDELQYIEESVLHANPNDIFWQRIVHNEIQAAKFTVTLLQPDKTGENIMFKIVEALINNTKSTSTMPKKGYPCANNLAVDAVEGAAAGCVAGAIDARGIGCAPGATAGYLGGVVGGCAQCLSRDNNIHVNVSGGSATGGSGTGNGGAGGSGGCFGTSSRVETSKGIKQLSDIELGDYIKTSSVGGETYFTEFLGWMDRDLSAPTAMLDVFTSNGQPALTLSKSHIVFTPTTTKYADELLPGDSLLHWNGTSLEETSIEMISPSISYGYWAPLTRDGHLLVDGYLTSCYASYPHQLSELAMLPIKAMPKTLLDDQDSQHVDGVRTAISIIKQIGNLIGARKGKAESNQLFKIGRSAIPSVMMKAEF